MTRDTSSMVEPNRVSSINAVLSAQLDTLAQIEALLTQEREALESRDPQLLLDTADAKSVALARLRELEDQRRSMSIDLDSPKLAKVRKATTRCRVINQENALVLNAQQSHLDRLLGLLRGTRDNRPSSYDASGMTTGKAAQKLRLTQV